MNNTTVVAFLTENEYYLYDRYTNNIFHTDKESVESLFKSVGEFNDSINNEHSSFSINAYSIPEISISRRLSTREKVQRKVYNKINRLCFISTEECNLRCEYCVYSGAYFKKRTHNSNNRINWDTAKKAIDLFLSVSVGSTSRTISFYGGESLLEFPLILKVVEYLSNLNVSVEYSLNTNLTLLTPEIARFLISHKFKLSISLDGPAEVHDRFRLTKNKKPTHYLVEKNLFYLRSLDESFFINSVSFNVVIVPHDESLDAVDNYFARDLFKGLPINAFHVLTLNPDDNSFFERHHYMDFLGRFDSYSKSVFIRLHTTSAKDYEKHRISYNRHLPAIKRIYFRNKRPLDQYEVYWPNSICILGMRSLLFTANGLIYPCETLYDKKELSIGSITKGIDADFISRVTEEYISKCNELCRDCWAYRFCYQCFSSSYEKGVYSDSLRQKECTETKRVFVEELKLYVSIISRNVHAFEYLNEIGPEKRNPEIESDD